MRILSRLAARFGREVEVHLFGCEEDDPEFLKLARDFPFQNHGVLKRPEVAALLARSDLFLDLSDYQAFGRTGLEAMASGCVAVLPLSGGADEYAIDDVNALVVDTLDEETCLGRIETLLRVPGKLADMQIAGLRTASRYSIHAAAVSELTLFARQRGRTGAKRPQVEKPRLCLVPALTADKGTPRTPAASGYVRLVCPYWQPAVLREWHVETCATGGLPSPDSADVVMLQRDAPIETRLDDIANWLEALRRARGSVVYDLDDDLLDAAALRQRGKKGDVEALARRVRYLAENADLVTVSTPALAKRLAPLNANISVVPNFVDGRLWKLDRPRLHDRGPYARQKDVVRIGYVGTPTHDGDLAVVRDAVRRIEKEFGARVSVEVIGAFQSAPPTFGNRIGLPRRNTYPAFVDWLDRRVHWDIAIIPLAADAFNRSKSHLKFLECACLDLAIVCSDVESYAGVARDGDNCLAVPNHTEAWCRALGTLIDDRDLRARLAAQARRDVIDGYTTAGNAQLYLDTLERVRGMDAARAANLAAE